MANGDGGVSLQEKERNGFADDVAAAHHNRVLARNRNAFFVQQINYPGRSTGDKLRGANQQCAGILDMETINVFSGRDRGKYARFADVRGQRQLDQHGVDARVSVELLNLAKEGCLGRIGGECVQFGKNASHLAGTYLVSNVRPRGGVVADHYDGESRTHTTGSKRCDPGFQLTMQCNRMGLSINSAS